MFRTTDCATATYVRIAGIDPPTLGLPSPLRAQDGPSFATKFRPSCSLRRLTIDLNWAISTDSSTQINPIFPKNNREDAEPGRRRNGSGWAAEKIHWPNRLVWLSFLPRLRRPSRRKAREVWAPRAAGVGNFFGSQSIRTRKISNGGSEASRFSSQ